MIKTTRVLVLACALSASIGAFCAADDAAPKVDAPKITVTTSIPPKTHREYLVKLSVNGKIVGSEAGQSNNLDVLYSLKIAHDYGRREADGLLPLEITARDVDISVNGNHLSDASTFPKITALLDHDWRITSMYGIDEKRKSFPGINYANMIMLFYLYGGEKPHSIGESWETHVRLPDWPETYTFRITPKSTDEIDGMKAVLVHEDISWAPDKQGSTTAPSYEKATADSTFSIDDGRLIKSHLECDVEVKAANNTPSQQDSTPYRANIKLDISLIK